MQPTPVLSLLLVLGAPAWVLAEPEYVTIALEIDVDRPAAEVWEKIGDYCAVEIWGGVDCRISFGDGGIGSVRMLANGRVTEVMVAQTELSYGYALQPAEGEYYNLYHGFVEARPVTSTTAKIFYTLVYDNSQLGNQAERDADIKSRRERFEGALANMKAIAEAE